MKLETFPSRVHHRTWMRWHDTCTRVSTVSVVSVSRLSRFLSKFSARTTKRVSSNVVKDHFDRSQYFSVWWGKMKTIEDLPGSTLRATVVHKTLKILPPGVNLCRRTAASVIALERAEWFDLQLNFLFWTRPKHSLPIRIGSQKVWFTW